MTSKERMLTAFRNLEPDMVPVSPDMSNMIPAKLTGRPFWEIYLHADPPLWKAYIEAVKKYEIDGWQYAGRLGSAMDSPYELRPTNTSDKREFRTEIVGRTDGAIIARTYCTTPAGELWCEAAYYRDQPPWPRRKYVKDLEADFEKLKYFYPDPSGLDDGCYREMVEAMGDLGATGLFVGLPGLHDLFNLIDGGFIDVVNLYLRRHDLVKELAGIQEGYWVSYLERGLKFQPEFVSIGASGLLTLQSPRIFRDLSLGALKRLTRMAREADIPSHLHACGLEAYLVEVAAAETDLDSIEPLESPARGHPNADCDLAEIKRRYGDRIALKGNLDTTMMLIASPEEVEREAKWCIDVAAPGGGFVLSTGDQLGRETPPENIHKMVEVARTYGRYPLASSRR